MIGDEVLHRVRDAIGANGAENEKLLKGVQSIVEGTRKRFAMGFVAVEYRFEAGDVFDEVVGERDEIWLRKEILLFWGAPIGRIVVSITSEGKVRISDQDLCDIQSGDGFGRSFGVDVPPAMR